MKIENENENEIRAEFEGWFNNWLAMQEDFPSCYEVFNVGYKYCQKTNDTVIAAKDAEIARLQDWVSDLVQKHTTEALHASQLKKEIARLHAAINLTLEENGNLADGDNCTLIHLKKVMGME